MNALTTTTPAEAFRAKASELLMDVAQMTLHELVDEFQRLSDVMDNSLEPTGDHGHLSLNDEGELAQRQQRLVVGATRSRYGISFEAYDRKHGDSPW